MEAGSARVRNHANLIWGIAELLRGDYKRADYGKVILPLAVMRRLDQVLEPTRDAVRERAGKLEAQGIEKPEPVLRKIAGQQFFNTHPLRFHQLLDDPGNIAGHLRSYIDGFSLLARDVVEKFEFDAHIDRLDRSNLLYQVIGRICQADLHPDKVSNHEMGAIFEELIRRFAEQSNETAGEHFTPREVVRLMVNLLLSGDEDALREPGIIREVFDCACGTGGMLSEADDQIRLANTQATVRLFGQELNAESYAICLADMLVKGQDASHIVFGNSLSADGHAGQRFDYCIANPPFGVDWTKVADEVRDEHDRLGFDGRFGPGLPRKSDGQLLFLMHLMSKLRDADKRGTRIAIVHNGSPLFTGAAGSGESEIRRWLIENDRLEAIVALPEQLFYNTGIASYVWVLTNRKSDERRGKVQLIDARAQWVKMRKSLGEKRRELSAEQIEEVTKLHGAFVEGELVKIVDNESFGYRTITIDRPLRARWGVSAETWEGLEEERALARLDDVARAQVAAALRALPAQRWETAAECAASLKACMASVLPKPSAALAKALAGRCLVRDSDLPEQRDAKGEVVWDPELRDTEDVPLVEEVEEYMASEVLPHVPDAVVADRKGRIGYEIPFTRLFYRYPPPRPSAEIKAELTVRETQVRELLEAVLNRRADQARALRELVTSGGWRQVPLKYYAHVGTGHTPSRQHPEYWKPEECRIPWFTLADVNQIRDGRRTTVLETSERLSEIGIANSAAVKHPAGTVLLSRTASVGFSALMGVDMAVSQDFMTWTCGPEIEPRYLLAALRAMQPDLRGLMYGSTHQTIYMPDLHALRIPLPPLHNQLEIISIAEIHAEGLWRLFDDLAAMRDAMEEYRVALLAEAVTGVVREGEYPEVLTG